MKKILSLLLAIIMVMTLAACNKQSVEITRGTIEGDVYKNETLGVEFTKPSSWVYATDEQIAASVNVAIDTLLGDNFKEALENNPAIYDMMVVDMLTGTNINVVYENLEKTFAKSLTIEQYVDALKQQVSNVSGMTVSFSDELEKVKLGESEFTKCVCDTTVSGINMTQVYYLCKIDGYMMSVIVTITSGYTVTDIEAMFK